MENQELVGLLERARTDEGREYVRMLALLKKAYDIE
jgi:hypothetical protein